MGAGAIRCCTVAGGITHIAPTSTASAKCVRHIQPELIAPHNHMATAEVAKVQRGGGGGSKGGYRKKMLPNTRANLSHNILCMCTSGTETRLIAPHKARQRHKHVLVTPLLCHFSHWDKQRAQGECPGSQMELRVRDRCCTGNRTEHFLHNPLQAHDARADRATSTTNLHSLSYTESVP